MRLRSLLARVFDAVLDPVETAFQRPDRPAAELLEGLKVIRGEGQRLGRIVDALLLLARADAGQLPVHREPLYLEEVAKASERAGGVAVRRDAPDILDSDRCGPR